ncbi:glycosyltransferase family 4 protein [Flavobacterium sp.]|uniref:glycosyltransferase family 4 protein n=1 Tax=Flavobacterium sp. TaxID=239 RepID=UPI0025BD66A5|nr:glycosyltransferase family 4 protein [Flavobacterium sp.]
MKTVLISAYTCCPNRGSEPGNGWSWLMGYIQNGYTIHCVTSDRYVAQIEKFCKENNFSNLIFHFSGYNIARNTKKIPIVGEYLHYYLWLIKARKRVKQLIAKYEFDHVHHVTFSSIKFGTPVYNTKLKLVIGPLGGGELPDKSLKKYLGRDYYLEAVKYKIAGFLSFINPTVAASINSSDRILVSNDIAAAIVRKYSSANLIRMFDAGLPENFRMDFIEREIDGVVNILWIGSIIPRKGLNLTIEAVAALPADMDFHFFIVGDGPLMQASQELISTYNLQSKTTFTGKVSYDTLKDIFSKAHLLLFPSLIDSCPMQVFECMAYSLPVVTLDHQGMKEQVPVTAGIRVPVERRETSYAQKLATGIRTIISDPEKYHQYSLNAYKIGQQQLWSKRIEHFVKEIL